MRTLLVLVLLVGLVASRPAPAFAGDLQLRITGIRSDLGMIRVGLFATPQAFDQRKPTLGKAVPAHNDHVTMTIEDLAPGTYGVAFYHDEDGNNRHDKSFIGVPLEGYGFAHDARGFLGPPDFEDMAVAVPAEGTARAEGRLRYGLE